MAASSFALACDALARERDRVFLLKVSSDYNIPYEELETKYLAEAEAAIKVPKKKGPRKAKVTVEGQAEAPKCTAMTAKKGQCSFASLKGECFCKRHLKQQGEPKQEVPKAVKPPTKKVVKVEPVHTHAVDGVKHADCDPCQSHGNILEEKPEAEFEEAVSEDDEDVDNAKMEEILHEYEEVEDDEPVAEVVSDAEESESEFDDE